MPVDRDLARPCITVDVLLRGGALEYQLDGAPCDGLVGLRDELGRRTDTRTVPVQVTIDAQAPSQVGVAALEAVYAAGARWVWWAFDGLAPRDTRHMKPLPMR
jgi:hypothetical protein